jgi:hypothetical protein
MIADVEDWAYDFIAKSISGKFRKYEATTVYFRDLIRGTDSVDAKNFDVIMGFFWYDMFLRGKLVENLDNNKICVTVQSHNSWLKRDLTLNQVESILSRYPAVGFSSVKLIEKFPNLENKHLTPTGYEPRYFSPTPLPSFDGKLRVCWAGDPEAAHHGDVKGYYRHILPAIEAVENVELITTTKADPIKHTRMGEFYSRGHLYLSMSANEGTPMPLLEAMACGRPVITTNAGIAKEVIDETCGWLIPRTTEDLIKTLKICHSKIYTLQEMGICAFKNVEERVADWSAMHYEKMFDAVYDHNKAIRGSSIRQTGPAKAR